MFYLGADVNPSLPQAIDPNPERVVPSVKPKTEYIEAENLKRAAKTAAAAMQATKDAAAAAQVNSHTPHKRQRTSLPESSSILSVTPMQAADVVERRALLKEIKDHLDILNEFKGVIPESELADQKRKLYATLPKL